MAFRLYGIAVASLSAALLLLWVFEPLWSGLELAALATLVSPFYLPLLYRFAARLWVARRRRRLGLPDASDRDLIDFVGEELDRAGIAWQWRLAMRGTTHADEIEIGEVGDGDLTVRVRNGMLFVADSENGTSRHVDPVAAVDDAVARYDGPKHPDPGIFAEDAGERPA